MKSKRPVRLAIAKIKVKREVAMLRKDLRLTESLIKRYERQQSPRFLQDAWKQRVAAHAIADEEFLAAELEHVEAPEKLATSQTSAHILRGRLLGTTGSKKIEKFKRLVREVAAMKREETP